MNIQKMLSDARKLGLPESDISRITTLSEKYNRAQTQSSDKPSKTYEPRNLVGQKAEEKTFRTKGDFLRDKEKTEKHIKTTRESIKEAKKEKKEAFWIVSRKDRKKAEKAAVKRIKDGTQQLEDYNHHMADLDASITIINSTISAEMSQSKTELDTIATSIQTQLATKKQLTKLTKMMKKIDVNDTKYAPLIAFFNANANRTPSLDNPLPEVPAEVQDLINEYNIEKAEKVIRLTTDVAIRTYTAGNAFTKQLLTAARDSMLQSSHQPRLLGGAER